MIKIGRVFQVLRNNWKKSVFGAVVIYYGANYIKSKHETRLMMKAYCEEARKYGEQPLSKSSRFRHVTVILNPAANKRKAKDNFEKYCAPLLYLAGICVDVVQTEYEGHARGIVEELKEADAIVVAAGDGTLSEVVTGLFRRSDGDIIAAKGFPVGILPLGRTNSLGNALFAQDSNTQKTLAEAALSVIREVTKPVDVMKIETTEEAKKPVYALSDVQWGAYRDAKVNKDKYWYFGSLRPYAAYVFGGMKSSFQWLCNAEMKYSLPCPGCSRCRSSLVYDKSNIAASNSSERWWKKFVPKFGQTSGVALKNVSTVEDYSNISNESCGTLYTMDISTVEFSLTTNNIKTDATTESSDPHLILTLGPPTVSYTDFVKEGWRREGSKTASEFNKLLVQEVKLVPQLGSEGKEQWLSIDNDNYELKPMNITLLPKKLHMYCLQKNCP